MSRNGLWIVAAGVAGFVAAITYWIVSVRRRWLAEELAWLSANVSAGAGAAK